MIFGVNTLRDISKWSREVTYNNFEISRYKGRYTRGILLLEHASGARSGSKAPPCVSTSSWVYFILVNNNRNESFNMIYALLLTPDGGVLLVIFGGGLPPSSPNPDPISVPKNVIFHTRLLTRSLKSRPILAGWPYLAFSRLSHSGGDSPVSYRFISVFALSQLGGPNYLVALNMNRRGLIRQKL